MPARRRLPAASLVVALVVGLLTTLAPPAAVAASTSISAGTVHWGIKESWRTYIGAGVQMTGGVTRADDGAFDFPVTGGSFDDATKALTLSLGGKVRFAAYCDDTSALTTCLLDSTFSNLRLTISADVQEIRGDYDGISRDTPGGAITHYGDVVLASIDARDAAPTVENGTTRWPALATVAGDGFPLYPAGTTMDPVTVGYDGPGGAPDLGEHWSVPGTPAFAAGGSWVGATDPANRDVLVGARSLHLVERATSTATAITVRALDPSTLAAGATIDVPVAANASYLVANDPASDRVFVAAQVRTTVGGVRGGDVTVSAVTWTGERYEKTTVGVVSGIAFTLNAMAWNPVVRELAVITQARGAAADRFTFTRFAGGTGAAASIPISLPTDAPPSQVAATLFGQGAVKAGGTLVALRDGSYAAVGGLADGRPIPVRRLVVGAASVVTSFVPGSAPTVQPLAAEWGQYFAYELAAPASDGGLLLYSANWTGVIGYLDVVDGAATMVANDVRTGVEGYAANAGADRAHGLDYVLSQTSSSVDVFRDHHLLTSVPLAGFARDQLGRDVLAVLGDGSLVVQVADGATKRRALQRWTLTGVSPVVSTDPVDRTIELPAGTSSASVSFAASGTGDIRWQIRSAGATRFADVPGATTPALTLDATVNSDGTQVRAVFSNAAGTTVSAVATIHVTAAPFIEAQPTAPTVYEGQPYELSVLAAGKPAPTITWQRRTADGWADVTDGVDGARVVVASAPRSDDGAVYRARLQNTLGTVYSAEVHVTVRERPSVPVTTTYTDVVLEWAGSPEWQHRPPNGSAANYFSAGVSDGTAATYRSHADGVEIVQRAADGSSTPATWETRGAHVTAGGQAAQLMRFTRGTAVMNADGSASVHWPGSVSVNFYDGLVPFTLTDPTLTVGTDGRGTLVADLAGYSGDMANPDKPKEPVEPRTAVTVATFAGVVVDAQRGFVATPDFDGVRIDPRGGTAQVTAGSGWGAWPQSFIDFHTTTHLAAYFYSTGGSMDAAKRPAAIGVGFTSAGVPQVPATPETPVVTPPVIEPVASTAVSAVREGVLLWGVKSSFRSYITGGIAKGSITVADGASTQNGVFRFGQTSTDWSSGSGTGTASYGGATRFYGHAGVLDLTFSNPAVRIDSARQGTLFVTVNGARVAIGALDLGAGDRTGFDGGVAYANVPVSLTAEGAGVFSYGSSRFYAPGTAMDPVTFVVGAAAGAGGDTGGRSQAVAAYRSTDWKPPAAPPADNGLYISPATLDDLRPGSEIIAVGAGFDSGETGIKVVLYSDPVVLEQNLSADATGTATWTGIVPLDTPPGAHTLTFQGSKDLGIRITVREPAPLTGCTVDGATLDWGFKESFRSYISGSIAHGEWTVSDGATYRTPRFGWSGGTGTFDSTAFTGRVSFPGTVRFTGHDGLLDTTVANPTLVFTGRDHAQLLLDVTGLTMDDALAGRTDKVLTFAQVPFVDIDLSAATVETSDDGTRITVTDAPSAITSQGYTAFPNYEAGTAFDAVSFAIPTSADCAAAPTAGDDTAAIAAGPGLAPAAADGVAWPVWLGAGAVAAAVIALGLVLVVRRRRAGLVPKTAAPEGSAAGGSDEGQR